MRLDFVPLCVPPTQCGGPRRLSLATAAMLAIGLVGCSQDMPTQRSPQKPNLSGAVGAGSKGDILAQPRFALDVKVSGQLVPGQPITIEATTRAVFPAAAVQLRIATPEIDAARSSGWGADFEVPVGAALPAANQTEVGLSRGAFHTQSATVEVAAPGYYRVVASASAVRKDRELANGQDIQDLVVKELWLLVTPTGGRITETYDPTVFPDSVLRQPGPFRSAGAVAAAQSDRIRTLSIGTRTWTVVFYDNNSYSYKPLAWAAVSGSVTDGINTWPVSTITNASGTFTTQCNTDLATFNTLAVDVEDDYIKVTPNTEVVSVVRRLSACGGSQLIALSDPSKVFSVMEITAVAAETKFSRVRPQLKVQIAACGSTSCYDAVGDSILLNSTHVWGYVGVMTQAHEYGHAYHNKALSPLPSDMGNPTDCSGHGGPVYTNLACAYKEGFAEYFAVLAWPDTANLHGYSPEANPNLLLNSNPFPADSNNPDGSIIEGAVQAFLYDITDPANETGDAIAYSTGYLGDIMATCQVSDGGGDPTHPSGIDHVIRCLEQQVDSSVNGYFYYRNPASTSETESATEPPGWSRSNIRTLWLKDLYNR